MLVEETGKTYLNASEDYQMLPDCLRYFKVGVVSGKERYNR